MTSTWWLYTGLPVLLIYALTAAVIRFGPTWLLEEANLPLVHFGALALSAILLNATSNGHIRMGDWQAVIAMILAGVAVAAAAVYFLRRRQRLPLLSKLYFGLLTVYPLIGLLLSLTLQWLR
jgi:hypothetical protein